ncbi:TPA: hypothetical protein KOQ85_001802 [Clostridioides difficile]|uniref:hypothetical protein n=1 Tax=Clostridioides difficile TaxID=1496 RepID=UPI0010287B14|nr:hypothetical protein [Clostridioides difficile]VFF18309.1 Uncharacterised protein [Clostridioides difficile]VFF18859.1 Uncharacterised protein [Clostridioides difficile]VFF29114.1 Uncharacterised protein [Clostridioides difficile]VIC69819.1 Uncharacterised protein [Clostridioides difficile]HBF2883478.1 hypothetical protein [Clostridioides difficile]
MFKKVEKIFSGSVNPNFMEDDPTFKNYLALYCCIKPVKIRGNKKVLASSTKACSALKIREHQKKERKKVRLVNAKTGEIKEMAIDEAENFLNVKDLYPVIRRGRPTRTGWYVKDVSNEERY